jgi:hypothetical protein
MGGLGFGLRGEYNEEWRMENGERRMENVSSMIGVGVEVLSMNGEGRMENVSSTIGLGVEMHSMNGEKERLPILLSPFSFLHSPSSILLFDATPAVTKKKVHSKKKGRAFARPSVILFHKSELLHFS